MIKTRDLILLSLLCLASLPQEARANPPGVNASNGIPLEEGSVTKNLTAVGKAADDTNIYTDTGGLDLPVRLNSALPPPAETTGILRVPSTAPAATPSPSSLAAPTAPAQPAPVKQRSKFEIYDTDGNGLISKDEFIFNVVSIHAEDLFKSLDLDQNGVLTGEEFKGYAQTTTNASETPDTGPY
ncbi:MAG: EF-hand domain-containing protein [Alphaproteobacteria bacterium]|nr:EF-hand domain-containing protein [Alphaproteobacteria bacterium]